MFTVLQSVVQGGGGQPSCTTIEKLKMMICSAKAKRKNQRLPPQANNFKKMVTYFLVFLVSFIIEHAVPSALCYVCSEKTLLEGPDN